MEVDKRALVLIFGLVGTILGFVVGVLFNSINYIMGCYIFISIALLFYTILVYTYNKNSRDFMLSYAVTTGWMFLISLMTHIVVTDIYTSPNCKSHMNSCAKYIFCSVFGFMSSLCFLIASYLSFKIAHVL
ncbi:conserved Plasmodium protein, unknown function [Plasmodium chabaudi chabaudi]|uniref:Uncharacterized protein n=2 Tax=Plasmodium chabaudi TaxID=5825 RepID=A0A077XCL4_PLACU|nr:conserved Plasmodium protein, unknown function [Plasmodium chabaudi chabaudi]SCM20641.1 conserved Plasmodium protein, unknown function [Plasmodium chabaudi adami]SCM21732.1 conserved Plasmodium protein, unknown function [Plasmodium chabaudi chabaudi]SCN60078.1 conserved Plasmodium protein, unknown function [Plasmodium chabaudi chabaudi]VTZ68641.1 conserved Plasmodium protein, unknown function [Plasmodium chabaudi chabaudi]|eukprot:XP_016655282.1 conserved Plasmodium protein, unknown function [Plasmodium chabaudi chabaudi]